MKLYELLPLLALEKLYACGLPIQSFTVYHLISLLIFPFLFLLKKIERSPILSLIILFCLYTMFTTILNVQLFVINNTEINFYPIFRQIAGLTVGVVIFFALRSSFKINPIKSLKFLFYSLYIILLFVLVSDIGSNNRIFRLYGSFTEPSHLGQYLVFILLPSVLLMDGISKRKRSIILSLLILLVFLTFSLSTYIRLFLFLLFYALVGNFRQKLRYSLYIVLATIVIVALFLTVFKKSYVVMQFATNLYAFLNKSSINNFTASLIDRIQFLYIVKNFFNLNLNGLWGIGVGFEKYYMCALYPPEVFDIILSVKQFPSYINSFWGKIFVYDGFIGGLIFILILIETIRMLKIIDLRKRKIILAAILSIYTYAFFGIAPFQSTELWIWIAFVDAYHLYIRGLKST